MPHCFVADYYSEALQVFCKFAKVIFPHFCQFSQHLFHFIARLCNYIGKKRSQKSAGLRPTLACQYSHGVSTKDYVKCPCNNSIKCHLNHYFVNNNNNNNMQIMCDVLSDVENLPPGDATLLAAAVLPSKNLVIPVHDTARNVDFIAGFGARC